jgi:hypothetical protein
VTVAQKIFDVNFRFFIVSSSKHFQCRISTLIEKFATAEQKAMQYDLADYLIEQQQNELSIKNRLIDE